MQKLTGFLGLDVHKDSISAALCDDTGRSCSLGSFPNTPEALARLVRKLSGTYCLQASYEAGPCGYVVYHQMQQLGIPCLVAAPTLIPVRSGDRVKTDRRDALKLARLLRAGELTAVWVPGPDHQALRDLLRCRLDIRQDQRRAFNRLNLMLLREGLKPAQAVKPGSEAYKSWLLSLTVSPMAKQHALRDYIAELEHQSQRLQLLEAQLAQLMPTQPPPIQRVVTALQSLYGVKLLTAATVVAEAGEMNRFSKAGQLFSYAGLVPSEHSSGGPAGRHQGGLTKTGNAHLRRVLVEAAWHYQKRPGGCAAVNKRRVGQDPVVVQIAEQARKRLYRKFTRLVQRGKPSAQAAVAVARELLGFMWAIAAQVQPGPTAVQGAEAEGVQAR